MAVEADPAGQLLALLAELGVRAPAEFLEAAGIELLTRLQAGVDVALDPIGRMSATGRPPFKTIAVFRASPGLKSAMNGEAPFPIVADPSVPAAIALAYERGAAEVVWPGIGVFGRSHRTEVRGTKSDGSDLVVPARQIPVFMCADSLTALLTGEGMAP